jgi:hypothetical protein
MTALTMDRKTDQMGTPDVVWPQLLNFPVEANTTIYGGALVALNAAGNAVPASAVEALRCVGRCERGQANTTAAGFGAAGALTVQVHPGVFFFNCPDSSIAAANVFQNCYAVDDNNVSLSDAGGTRPYAGIIYAVNSSSVVDSGQVAVFVGMPNAYAANPELASGSAFSARAVVTTLHAYTGTTTGVLTSTANGAFGTQDGVTTLAAGDVVIIPAGTTNISAASDAGPYQITALGAAGSAWVLTRPDWWPTGGTIGLGASIKLGGEGTLFGGTVWKSFAAKGTVIDTSDPALYPDKVTQSVALTAGTKTITNVPIYSATRSSVLCSLSAVGGTVTTTVGYGTIVAATPGALGTASAVVDALAAGMTKQASDTSTILVTILNG